MLDNAYKVDQTYKLEDFFWTGSGDGSGDENHETTSTIYKTILSTVYVDKPSTHINQVSVTFTIIESTNIDICINVRTPGALSLRDAPTTRSLETWSI